MALDFEPHKDLLRCLYVVQGKKLQEVMLVMEERHGLKKSRRQYEGAFKRWGFTKNVQSNDWKIIHHKVESRRKRGKQTSVYRGGRLVPSAKLRKESRHYFPTPLERYTSVPSPETPETFFICTPTGSEPTLILLHNLPTVHLHDCLHLSDQLFNVNRTEHPRRRLLCDDTVSRWPCDDIDPYRMPDIEPSSWNLIGGSREGLMSTLATAGCHHALQRSDHSQTVQDPHQLCLALHFVLNNLSGDGDIHAIETLFKQGARQLLHALRTAHSHVSKAFIPALLRKAIEGNDIELANEVLLGTDYDPNSPINRKRDRPLEIAVAKGKDDLIWLLLACGADPNLEPLNSWNESPMMTAVKHGRVGAVELLLMFGVNVNSHRIHDYTRALITAVKSDHLQIATLLLEAGADVNGCDRDDESQESYGFGPLQIASENGNIEIVRQLLQHGADARASSGTDTTPVELAASNGHSEIAHLLICYGATLDVDVELTKAAQRGYIEVVRVLINYGANINAQPPADSQYTALQAAVSGGFYSIVQLFIDLGATINDPPGHSALVIAAKYGHKDVVRLLMDHGADVNARFQDQTALQVAVLHNNTDIAELLLEFGADINAPSQRYTALQAAAYNQNFVLVELLLRHGAEINAPAGDRFGTALRAAISGGGMKGTKLARLLIVDWGADVNAKSSNGTALHIASSRCNVSAVRLLLHHGAHVSAVANLLTPLDSILIHCNTEREWDNYGIRVVELLLDAGASMDFKNASSFISRYDHQQLKFLLDRGLDVNIPICRPDVQREDGQELNYRLAFAPAYDRCCSLLQAATRDGDKEMVSILLGRGADVNTPALDFHGITALQVAAKNGDRSLVQMLLSHGADVNAEPAACHGRTALQAAAESGDRSLVQMLLSHGADVNAEPAAKHGRTALQAAAWSGDNHIVSMLLDHGADINAKPAAEYGVTALQAAAIAGNIQVVVTLLESGADVNASAAPVEGRTAIEGAAEHGRLDTVQLLLNVGAEVKGTRAMEFALAEGHVGVVALLESY